MHAIILVGFATTLSLLSAPAALANECDAALKAGTIKSYVALAHCTTRVEARMPQGKNGDLAKFLAMRRLQIAVQMDKGELSVAEGAARIQAVVVDVQTEVQKRDAMAAQAQAAQAQSQASQQPKSLQAFCQTFGTMTMCY